MRMLLGKHYSPAPCGFTNRLLDAYTPPGKTPRIRGITELWVNLIMFRYTTLHWFPLGNFKYTKQTKNTLFGPPRIEPQLVHQQTTKSN